MTPHKSKQLDMRPTTKQIRYTAQEMINSCRAEKMSDTEITKLAAATYGAGSFEFSIFQEVLAGAKC